MTSGRLTIWIAAFSTVVLGAARAPIYVGVLEAPLDDTRGQFHVRVAFRFEDGRWSSMPQYADNEDGIDLAAKFPSQVSWTIALRGKKLGQVNTLRAPGYGYSSVGLEDLSEGSKPPGIAEDAAAFATWMGAARYRPLLAISEPNYDDPNHWAPYDAPPAMRIQALAAFRRKIALDPNCDGKSTRSYSDSAIQVYGKPYRSMSGDALIAMRPDQRLNRCDGPAGDEWQSVWFHSRGDNYHWIGNSLTLLDIGDYNGDGVAKILFQYDGYNRDGYMLLEPRDDSRTEFSWSYH